MPASLPSSPFGRVASMALRRWVPSARVSLRMNGVKTPAVGSTVAAEKLGLFAASPPAFGQAPPPGPLSSWKELDLSALAASGADHGTRWAAVAKVPQEAGVLSGARGPCF